MSKIKQFEQYTDQEIISNILSGEIALYEIIIRRYNGSLFKTGRSYGFNHFDTEDVMQETYISAYTNLGKFENRSSFKTWLVKIMLNECYQKKQKFSSRLELSAENHLQENVKPMFTQNHSTADKTLLNKELGHVIENALQQLPEEYRVVFSLRELNQMSIAETSEALNISESNVKVRLNRAKTMLRNQIHNMYSPEDIFEFNLIYCDRIVENVMKRLQQK
ncbi:MAG: polymerase subunit sigma-24 [Chitinophagaceae bacterium]|nr:polymerase subunit sigma-24 [Chitinophagaceae bacterium]